MAECKACGTWFSSSEPQELCPGCERALERLNGYGVPVVRCNDCAVPHNKYTGCPKLNGLVTPPDFFCPFGEQKKGE